MLILELYQLIRKALSRNLITMTVIYGATFPTVSIMIQKATIRNGKIELLVED